MIMSKVSGMCAWFSSDLKGYEMTCNKLSQLRRETCLIGFNFFNILLILFFHIVFFLELFLEEKQILFFI